MSGSVAPRESVIERSALNSFPLAPRVVTLSLTERCPAACRMCVTESHPKRWDSEIAEADLLRRIDEASECDGVFAICLVGGEPFLRLPLLERLIARCRDVQKDVSVVTNAFWATSGRRARAILQRLQRSGLTRMTVSADAFHQEFVPLARVDRAIGAAHEVGLPCNLYIVALPEEMREERSRVLAELENAGRLDHVHVFPVLPVGTGRTLQLGSAARELPEGRCDRVLSTMSVTARGEVYACCGVGGQTPHSSWAKGKTTCRHWSPATVEIRYCSRWRCMGPNTWPRSPWTSACGHHRETT